VFSEPWKSSAGTADCDFLGVRGAALRGVVLSDAPGARFRVYLLPFLLSCSVMTQSKCSLKVANIVTVVAHFCHVWGVGLVFYKLPHKPKYTTECRRVLLRQLMQSLQSCDIDHIKSAVRLKCDKCVDWTKTSPSWAV